MHEKTPGVSQGRGTLQVKNNDFRAGFTRARRGCPSTKSGKSRKRSLVSVIGTPGNTLCALSNRAVTWKAFSVLEKGRTTPMTKRVRPLADREMDQTRK